MKYQKVTLTSICKRASPNSQSEVVEVEGNGNALFKKQVTPPEKKQKVKHYQKAMSGKAKLTREDIRTTNMMIKNTNGFDQVTKSMYTFKSLIGRLKILSTKENAARIKIEEVLFNLEVYSTFVLCLYRICDEKLLKILSKMFNICKACNFTKT